MSELEVIKKWELKLLPDLIRRIFRQVLERQYTSDELIEWGFKLNKGEISIKSMIQELALTEEHEDIFIRPFSEDIAIKNCFKHLLGRNPTPDEIEEWINVSLNEGIDDVIKRLIDSNEYDVNFGEDKIALTNQSICGGEIVFLRANDNYYVCAEDGGGRELVANRWKPLGWETFVIEKVNENFGEIIDGELIRLRVSNGMYVKINESDTGEVIATIWNPKDAESFIIGKISEGGTINDGDFISLKSQNDKYVCINSNGQQLCSKKTEITENNRFMINIQHLR